MVHEVRPLPFKPHRLDGLSVRLLTSHYENNYGGAVRRLNAIEGRLAGLDPSTAPSFDLNGLGRDRLIAANSMILHEIYFAGLGGSDEIGPAMADQLARDFGSFDRWRAEFTAMGRALAGGSGWVLMSWSPRLGRLVNQWAADHGHCLADGAPILALDMYEHAYALDFGAGAAAYIDCFMRNIHWPRVEARLQQARDRREPPTAEPDPPEITVGELDRLLRSGGQPMLLDVCLPEDVARRSDMIPGARFLTPEEVAPLAPSLPRDRPVVVYCIYGFQVSGEATSALRAQGLDAQRLAGGLAAWRAMAGPLAPLPSSIRGEST
ncbi:MAG TPA: Fe-Mn family superoxide dismutase [Dongiaceae bacterium]